MNGEYYEGTVFKPLSELERAIAHASAGELLYVAIQLEKQQSSTIMKLSKHNIEDKLNAFVLAGIATSTHNWDYAIPQYWFEELQRMGIQNPGQWFAADCHGGFAKLHHVGEAYAAILNHRSQANTEIFNGVFEAMWDHKASDEQKALCDFIINDDQVRDELESGFADLNLLSRAFYSGMAAARKSTNENA
jgi:hypothetical protein